MTSTTPTPQIQAESGSRQTRGRVWPWVLLGLVVIAGGITLFIWLGPVSSATQDETFAGPVDRLVVELTGAVDLAAGDVTKLTITKEWLFGSEPAVEVDETNGVVRVSGECPWFQLHCITSLEGTVSPDAAIEVNTSAGTIEVSGTTNGVDLETSAGAVYADGIRGQALLRTSAGNIIATVTDGDVEAETSAGRIEMTVLGDFSSAVAETSAGNIDLEVADEVYDVAADTSAGSVTIQVQTDPSAQRRIRAESSAGSITIKPAP